jgi:hypothetical protein
MDNREWTRILFGEGSPLERGGLSFSVNGLRSHCSKVLNFFSPAIRVHSRPFAVRFSFCCSEATYPAQDDISNGGRLFAIGK